MFVSTSALALAACDGGGDLEQVDGVGQVESQASSLITTRAGADYTALCRDKQVPIPPPWGAPSIGPEGSSAAWKYRGAKRFSDSFTNFQPADAYYWVAPSAPNGVCVIAAHTGETPDNGLFDLICQGTNGSACFWESARNPAPPANNAVIDLTATLAGGTALGTPTSCTSCHAGQNAFITHVKPDNHPLNLTALAPWMPSSSNFEPVVTRGSSMNTGTLRPEAYPASSTGCLGCHSASAASPKGGQFPDVTDPAYSQSFCDVLSRVVARPGAEGGMPPSNTCNATGCTAQGDPFVKELLARCGKGTGTSKAISPVAFERWSGASPYPGSWDHVLVGKKNDTTSTIRLFDNLYYTSYQGWSENVLSSTLNTNLRSTMWAKSDNSSTIAIASTDLWGNIWESQSGVRLVSSGAAGSPHAYLRHDGWNTIVYRGTDNYIYEAWWSPAGSTWTTGRLPEQTIRAMGDPIGYNRGSSSSIVYKCGEKLICELRLISGVWKFRSMATSAALKGETMPMPFKRDYREERYVFYTGTDGLHALLDNTEPAFGSAPDWRINPNAIVSSPIPYNAQDGGIRVAYITDPGGSSPSTLAEAVMAGDRADFVTQTRVNPPKTVETLVGDPAAFVATTPWRNTLLYRNSANTLYQLQTSNAGTGNVPYVQTIVAKGVHLNTSGSINKDAEMRWAFDLPAGHYRHDLTVSSGDVDLYVKLGSAPTTSSYDCRPYAGVNTAEACQTTISNLAGGTVYVMARGYGATSSYSLTGNHY